MLEAVAEYDRVGQPTFLTKYGFRPSLRYVLRVNGKSYDSKPLLGAAHGFATEDGPLSAKEFSGGEAHTKKVLTKLGFDVGPAPDWATAKDGSCTYLPTLELDSVHGWKNHQALLR